MDEYIKRETLLTDICDDMCGLKYTGVCENCRVVALIADTPAEDVAPMRHGYWVIDDYNTRECHCSECEWPAPRDVYEYHRKSHKECFYNSRRIDGNAFS